MCCSQAKVTTPRPHSAPKLAKPINDMKPYKLKRPLDLDQSDTDTLCPSRGIVIDLLSDTEDHRIAYTTRIASLQTPARLVLQYSKPPQIL